MNQYITIQALDRTTYTIFSQHISYIQHAPKGCIIHVNTGGQHVEIVTGFTWPEMVNTLGLKG